MSVGPSTKAWLLLTALASPLPAVAEEGTDGYREQMAATVDAVARSRSTDGASQLNNSVAFKSGSMSYEQSGFADKSDGTETALSVGNGVNATNGAVEFEWFRQRDLATFLGYRLAYNTDVKRTQYQAGYGGVRYFLYTPGIPTVATREFTVLRYNPKFRPYVEGGLSLGRYLARVYGQQAALDVSSEFYGAAAGIGAQFAVSGRTAVDLGAVYEYARGYGPVRFYATTLIATLGLRYYY